MVHFRRKPAYSHGTPEFVCTSLDIPTSSPPLKKKKKKKNKKTQKYKYLYKKCSILNKTNQVQSKAHFCFIRIETGLGLLLKSIFIPSINAYKNICVNTSLIYMGNATCALTSEINTSVIELFSMR